MKYQKESFSEENILNTNETMNDYSFYFQMICENKVMDFEVDEVKNCLCEERV
jgi:hypothetical protein